MKKVDIKVGNTPFVELKNIEKKHELKSKIFAKVESKNPAGSIKDRIAYEMISAAIKEGKIDDDTLIIEPTSGNTGIGIAYICKELGLKANIVMPSSMSKERIEFMEKYGAKVILSDGSLGMKGAIELANMIHKENPNSIILNQFGNMNNPLAHYKTTGPEIYFANKNIDILVAGVGTGGTLTGVGRFLKEKNPNLKVIAVEPSGSPVLSKGISGKHKIQGIGAGFIPETLDRSLIDEIVTVEDEKAFEFAREMNSLEKIGVGISSGAAVYASVLVAKKYLNKNIATILPDGIDRYLSLEQFK